MAKQPQRKAASKRRVRKPSAPVRQKTRGELNIEWIEQYCCVPEGTHVGTPLVLRPWQRKEICKIYDNPHGTRRAILSFGRKNGKTAISACLLLLHLCGPEARQNSQLYSAGQSRAQAALLFKLASIMVYMNADLRSVARPINSEKRIVCPSLGTEYRALSADASTAFGLSPVFTVHDELGQVRGPTSELYTALETGSGAHKDPLSIIISTQAPTENDLLSRLIDDAAIGLDQKVTLSLYTAPMDVDPFSEEAIKAANPAYGDFQNPEEALSAADAAKRMPSSEAGYRNYILNQRVEARSPFISRTLWDTCSGLAEDFGENPVYGGLDLSAVNDLTALVLGSRINGMWHVKPVFWLPGVDLAERARKDRVPYDVWERQGVLKKTPGASIGYDFVAAYLRDEVFGKYNVRKIAFDRWGYEKHFRPELVRAGLTEEFCDAHFEKFGQGFASMSPALRETESILLDGNLRHGIVCPQCDGRGGSCTQCKGTGVSSHPLLTMCCVNAVVLPDPAGNRKLDKSKSTRRIDGAVAMVMMLSTGVGDLPKNEVSMDDIYGKPGFFM